MSSNDMIAETLSIQNGKITASSRDIARVFGKRHYHVVRDIQDLDCSSEFKATNFGGLTYYHQGNEYPYYEMTRDGFTFLAMSFTGKKAARWKEAYINAFNEMEELLRQREQQTDNSSFGHYKSYAVVARGFLIYLAKKLRQDKLDDAIYALIKIKQGKECFFRK